ncbi:hypothetical protein OY671_005684, partial [Metschnikowia pulcherrima]
MTAAAPSPAPATSASPGTALAAPLRPRSGRADVSFEAVGPVRDPAPGQGWPPHPPPAVRQSRHPDVHGSPDYPARVRAAPP